MPQDLKIIHLDVDPWELGKNHPAEIAILGDPKATLPEITVAVRERMTSGARMRARERLDAAAKAIAAARAELKDKARDASERSPVEATALLHAIGEMLPLIVAIGVLIVGRGLVQLWKEDIANKTGIEMKVRLRERLYQHVLALGPGRIDQQRSGGVALSLVDGVEMLETFFGQYLPQLVVAALSPLIIFLFMAWLDWLTASPTSLLVVLTPSCT